MTRHMTTHNRRTSRQRRCRSFQPSKAERFGRRTLLGEQLEPRVLLAGDLSYHNSRLPSDTTRDGFSTPMDVLVIINELNSSGPRALYTGGSVQSAEGEDSRPYAYDVNDDGYLSPMDALNALNRINDGEGQGDVMKYVLKTFNAAGTQEISQINVGGTFQLQVYVDDLRTLGNYPPDHPQKPNHPREGVATAYLDVRYDPTRVAIPQGARVVHSPTYGSVINSNVATPGIVDAAGGFLSNPFLEPGPEPVLLWTLQFQATAEGVMSFIGEPTTQPATEDPGDAGQSPFFDTGIFAQDKPVCPSSAEGGCLGSMGFDNVSITIVRDIVAVDDAATMDEDVPANDPSTLINVMANDSVFVGPAKLLESFTQAANGTVTRFDNGTPSDRSDDQVRYVPNLNFNGTDTFTYTISNGQGSTATANVTVTVVAVNDAPVNTVPGAQTINEDTSLVFNGTRTISVSDVDADAGSGLRVTLTVANGRLEPTPNGATVTGANTGTVTITGMVAQVNAALNGLRYTPNENYFGSDTLTIVTDDQGNTGKPGPLTATSTVAITINPVDDPPVNQLPPSPQTTDEDIPLVLSTATGNAISIVDVDAGNEPAQVSLSLPAASTGTLTLASTTGLTFTQGDGTADKAMTFTGTLTAINAALSAGLTYTPALLFVGSDSLTVSTTSQGLTDTDVLAIEVIPAVRPRAINDSLTILEDAVATVINVLANDRANDGAQVTLLNFTQPANGVVTRNDNGTPDDLRDDTLSYRPNADFFGTDTFTYTINDTSGLGDNSTATVVVTVQAVNDPPELTAPGAQTIAEDTALSFGAGAFTVSDIDAGTANIEVTLSVNHGTLTVPANGATIQGNGTGNLTVTAPITAVNSVLSNLVYTPTLNFNGSDALAITVNDLGNTGSPGPLTVSRTVNITVTPVNDPPVNTVPPNQSPFITNIDNVLSSANGNAIQVSDVDAGTANIQVNVAVNGGTFTVINTSLVTVAGNGTDSVTLTGPQAQINQTLAEGLIYRHSVEGNFTVTVTTNDLGNTGAGGPQTDIDTFGLEVVDFLPSTIGGRVFIHNDLNRNGLIEANEMGAGLAGIPIRLTGTDFQNRPVVLEELTGRDGTYRFENLRPGNYDLAEGQPYGFRDGSDWFEAPVTANGNDKARVEIDVRGGITSLNNHFTELGLEAQYVTAWSLLASSDPNLPTGMGLVLSNGPSPWYIIKDSSTAQPWAGYHHAQFSMNADGKSGVLTVWQGTQRKQATLTVESGRLRPSQDGKVITIIGRPEDLNFTSVAMGEGEGGNFLAAAAADYQRGADAIFAAMGSQQDVQVA